MLVSGCYINEEIEPNEVGVRMKAGEIIGCASPGLESDLGWFADLKHVTSSTVTFNVSDPEVATDDNQLVSVSITIQARRRTDCDSLRNLMTNWPSLVDDQPLIDTISATAREGIKVGTRAFTLTQLLDDRNGLADEITKSLEQDADVYAVDIVNVTIENIGIDSGYAEQLREKALLTAQIETELRRQDLIIQQADNDILAQERRAAVLDEQLVAEQAETSVQLEIARRAGEIIAAQNAVYINNGYAYELERLRLIQGIMSGASGVYFLPNDTDFTMLFNPGSIVPIPLDDAEIPQATP
jgi:hypothetical protein